MVQAILEGRKTQTRRTLKFPQPLDVIPSPGTPGGFLALTSRDPSRGACIRCRLGEIGDRLWVRETWRQGYPRTWFSEGIVYRADKQRSLGMDEYSDRHHWKSPIFMPRRASRILLEITDVTVENLQSITYICAIAEGMYYEKGYEDPREAFRRLWDSINAKRAPWKSNPWVWASKSIAQGAARSLANPVTTGRPDRAAVTTSRRIVLGVISSTAGIDQDDRRQSQSCASAPRIWRRSQWSLPMTDVYKVVIFQGLLSLWQRIRAAFGLTFFGANQWPTTISILIGATVMAIAQPFINPDSFERSLRTMLQEQFDAEADRIADEAAKKYREQVRTKLAGAILSLLETSYSVERYGNDLRIIVKFEGAPRG